MRLFSWRSSSFIMTRKTEGSSSHEERKTACDFSAMGVWIFLQSVGAVVPDVAFECTRRLAKHTIVQMNKALSNWYSVTVIRLRNPSLAVLSMA